MTRSSRVRVRVGICAATFVVAAGAAAPAHGDEPEPFSRTALDLTGDAIASAAIQSKHPVGIAIGVTYKAVDLAHEIGAAAIAREDRWLGAELVLVDRDAARLQEMKHNHDDLNGPEATEIKRHIRERMQELTASDRSPAGYTASVIIKNAPYAVFKIGLDKALESAVGFGLERFVDSRAGKKAINWALSHGPLDAVRKGRGWGKLLIRAAGGKEAAEEKLREAEKKLVTKAIQKLGAEARTEAAADALSDIYKKIMMEHPSQARTVIAASFRLEMARQAVMLPAPVPIMRAAAPVAVPVMRAAEPVAVPVMRAAPAAAVPVMRAAPAAAVPVMRAATPAEMRAFPDPVVRAIRSDDAMWRREPTGSTAAPAEPPSRPAEAPVDARAEARRQALHDELMRVGDGKTFAVCSNGCNATGSWDGERGKSLTSR